MLKLCSKLCSTQNFCLTYADQSANFHVLRVEPTSGITKHQRTTYLCHGYVRSRFCHMNTRKSLDSSDINMQNIVLLILFVLLILIHLNHIENTLFPLVFVLILHLIVIQYEMTPNIRPFFPRCLQLNVVLYFAISFYVILYCGCACHC